MTNVRLTRERLFGTRIHAAGDVVPLPDELAQAVVRQGDGHPAEAELRTAVADQPPTVRQAVQRGRGKRGTS